METASCVGLNWTWDVGTRVMKVGQNVRQSVQYFQTTDDSNINNSYVWSTSTHDLHHGMHPIDVLLILLLLSILNFKGKYFTLINLHCIKDSKNNYFEYFHHKMFSKL